MKSLLKKIKQKGINAISVVFLNSYINSEHEQKVKSLAKEILPDAFISVSSEVSGQFREYERLCATVINSYVGPSMKKYLNNLKNSLGEMGIEKIYINHSNGGIMSVKEAVDFPIKTALSGPAAGVVGAKFLADLKKYPSVITLDIGGTSADVSIIRGKELSISKDREISGYPIRIPALDIVTIGAGGGSIAWVDSGGILKVGPQSAGADPGPACYDLGGSEATVTDARVVLGHLNQKELLNGRLPISYDKSVEAIKKIANKLNMGLKETAQGIILVANSNLVRAIKKVTIERGYNPENFVLVAFGGAGPLHAAELMRELNISKVLIPKNPGLLAAYGLLTEDIKKDFIKTRVMNLDETNYSSINEVFEELEKQAVDWFESEGITKNQRIIKKSLDMRYKGQNYEIEVDYSRDIITDISLLKNAFNEKYKRLYGYSSDDDIQIVNFCLTAIGLINPPYTKKGALQSEDSTKAIIGERNIYLKDINNTINCKIYDRELLSPGNMIYGPAIIEQLDSTTIILPNQKGKVDEYYNIIITNI